MDELAAVHYEIIDGLLRQGACPSNTELSNRLHATEAKVETMLRALSEIHGVVLHPHACEPWVIHPFSVTPTIHWIEGSGTRAWAPCIWCAFGVAALAGGEARIHTRIAAESEAVVITVRDGQPVDHLDLVVHFAIPPSRAWNNVHQHCSLVLPFRSVEDIGVWCQGYRHPVGQSVPIRQVSDLARAWYGRHARRDWRKWTMPEAQEIFHGVGLQGPFWDLGEPNRERF